MDMFLSAGHRSAYLGANALLPSPPLAKVLIADRGYDSDWFHRAWVDRAIEPCIPSRRGRKDPVLHDPVFYRQRYRIENMVARLKDWRPIATRYVRCPRVFLSACALASVVLFCL